MSTPVALLAPFVPRCACKATSTALPSRGNVCQPPTPIIKQNAFWKNILHTFCLGAGPPLSVPLEFSLGLLLVVGFFRAFRDDPDTQIKHATRGGGWMRVWIRLDF